MPKNAIDTNLIINNDVNELLKLTAYVEDISAKAGLDDMQTMNLELALEEAVTNVVLYAYDEGTTGTVNIACRYADKEMTFVITDNGKPFDPTASENPDITLSAEDRGIGGLGIFMVRNLMDDMHYERQDGKNVLTLKKRYND